MVCSFPRFGTDSHDEIPISYSLRDGSGIMHINGSDTETFSGYNRGPRTFVAAETKTRVQRLAATHGIGAEKVSRLLAQASDEDRYNRDLWRTTVGGLTFTFHLARMKVELRKAELSA
jgi:hypothetical protein